jgi:RHS repeat-associated protein
MQGRGFASVWGFLALVLVAGAAWALASWGLPEGTQVWLSSDTGVAQLGVSPDGTMALSTLLTSGGWLTTDATSGGLWLLNGQDHLIALGPNGMLGKPLDLAPALGSAQPLGVAVDGAANAAWVVTPDQLITVALGSAQIQRTPLPAGVVAWTQDAAQHTLWLTSDHRLTEYDAHGTAVTSFALPETPTAMAYDASSGQIWMAFANKQVARYTPSGQQTLQAPRPTMATGPMVADGAGGLWIAGRTHVVHLDAEGFVRVRTAVMAETDASAVSMPAAGIQSLAVDPVSHGAWVKTPTALVALDAAGRIVQSVPMTGAMSAGTFRSLVLRAVPPTGPPASPSPVQPTPLGGIHTPDTANTPAHSSGITSNTAQDARSAALQPCARGASASACAPVAAGAPSHPPARILWVAAGHDLYQLLPPASSAQALDRLPRPQTVAVDPTDGALWAYRHGQLWSVSPAGVVTVDVKLAQRHDDDRRAHLAIDGTHAIVWLAVGRTLTRLDTTGKILGTTPLKHGADGISLDTATGQLWVAEHHGLEAFNPSGSILFTTSVHGAIRALDADADLDAVWVATQRDLLRLNATGQVQLTVKMHGNADRRMVADGQGGLWIAGGSTLRHVSQTGVVGFTLKPLVRDAAEGGAIRALAADPLTHAVWVEGRHHLVEESLTQQSLAVIDSRTWSRIDESETHADHDGTQRHVLGPMALYVDTIPPVLTLVAPPVGTYTNKPQLSLSFSYSDVGSGVDPSTLTIQNTATGQPLAVSCQTTASTALCTPTSPLADGNYTLRATVQDYAGNTSKPVALQFTIDTVPPTITITSPTRTLTNQPDLTLAGTLSKVATLTVNGQAVIVNSALQFSLPITLTEGANTYTLVATDRAGNVTTTTLTLTLDTVPPPPPDLGLFNVAGPVNGQVTVTGQAGSVEGGDTVTLTDTVTGATVTVTANADGSFTATLAAGSSDPISVSVEDPAGNVTQSPTTIEASNLPPSPSSEAPTLPPTEQAPFVDQVSFLYSGSNPIQTGVAPGTIQPLRVAIVRGQVLDRANQPLSGVTVSVLGHPEYGQTLTRASGWFDLAVNGGGTVVLNFSKAGYLMAQRTVNVTWGNFAIAQPLVMITPDPVATPVTFGSTTPVMQVARSSVQVGQSGTRQTTVFIPAGTTATEELPNGTSQPITSAHLRATEFTVGANGPQAMPAALPATSAYTYAVDLSLDEAQAAGATTVTFSQSVPVYVNNYLGIPIGTAVPAGWYDPTVGAWKGSTDGVVLKFLGVDANGDAEVDLTGSGTPATAAQLSAYDITTAELAQIAKTFTPGQSFWRVLAPHFTDWDYNYGYNPQAGYLLPPPPQPTPPPKAKLRDTPHDHVCTGCQIDAENQRVGETIPIVGTPYALHYESATPESIQTATISFPVTTANPPGAGITNLLSTIQVTVDIAGRSIVQNFDPSVPNQTFTYTWDGLNAYGQHVDAPTTATIYLAYVWKESYGAFVGGTPGANQSFALPAGAIMTGYAHVNDTVASTRRWTQVLFAGTQSPLGLDRWSVTHVNAYDSYRGVLYKGDGSVLSGQSFGNSELGVNFAGEGAAHSGSATGDGGPATQATFWDPAAVAAAPDGTVYIWDSQDYCIRKVDPTGIITTFAGICGTYSNGELFTQAPVPANTIAINTQQNYNMAIGPGGSLYIGDQNGIVRITPAGVGVLVAGGGALAQLANLPKVGASAIGAYIDGSFVVSRNHSIYFIGYWTGHVWKIDQNGILSVVANNSFSYNYGIRGLTLSEDGRPVFAIATPYGGQVWEVNPQGQLELLAGFNGGQGTTYSPLPSLASDTSPDVYTYLPEPWGLATGPHGSIYYSDNYGPVLRLDPQGWIRCVVGCGAIQYPSATPFPAGGIAAESISLYTPSSQQDFAVGPDDSIYVTEFYHDRILKVSPAFPGLTLGESYVGSSHGHKLYVFNTVGQHIETLDALTGQPIYTFQYSSDGLLTSLTDAEGRVTTIQRDAQGNPISITAPHGQITQLSTQTVGGALHLSSVTNPAGDTWKMGYDSTTGVLTSFTDPNGNTEQYSYDSNGFLSKVVDANGGGWTLSRTGSTDQSGPYTVTMTSAMGRTYSFAVSQQSDGSNLDVATAPDGTESSLDITPSGQQTTTAADGTVTTVQLSADPRFGLMSPVPSSATIKTPSGLTWTGGETRSVNLQSPSNLLSLTSLTETHTVNGETWTSAYNPADLTWSLSTPAGRTSSVTVNSLDLPVEVSVPEIAPVTMTYDSAGRILSESSTSGTSTRTTSFSYYPSGPSKGWLESATDPTGQTVSYQYDPAGRVTQETLPDGSVVGFAYDANGNLTALTPPGESAHTFSYDAVNDTTSDTSPTVTGQTPLAFHYAYNLDRQLTGITEPDGSAVALAYDSGGRLSSVTLPGGSAYQYAYTAKTGQVASITAPGGEMLDETWDGFLNTQTQWVGPVAGTVSRTFDDNFRVTALAVDGTATNYGYDADGLLTQAGGLAVTRDAQNGRITGTTTGDVATARTYDGFGAVASLDTNTGTTPLYQASYTRDADGRITQAVVDQNGVTTTWGYSYDSRGRLATVSENGSVVDTYGYDANGNRISVNGQTVATYNADDQITSYNGVPYTYAADGSLAVVGTTTYQYDALGHLLDVKTPTETIAYTYDGLGRRVGKSVNGTLVQGFLYADGIHPLAELDGQGNVVETFVYGTRPNVPDLMIKGGVTYRIISDQLGSPVEVINTATGAVVEQITYDVWGNITSDTNPGFQPFGFAGGLYDADTGLVHFGARDYDPTIGRWTTRDPLGFAGGDTNLYGYVLQDPINGIDSLGLEWQASLGFGVSGAFVFFGGGGSVNIGITSSGSLFFQAEGDGELGLGAYLGGGFQGGISHTKCDLTPGWSQGTTGIAEADAGYGPAIGGSATFNGHDVGASTGLGKLGVGGGVWVGAGVSHEYTYATPTFSQMWQSLRSRL